jgi:hypothetical protein
MTFPESRATPPLTPEHPIFPAFSRPDNDAEPQIFRKDKA